MLKGLKVGSFRDQCTEKKAVKLAKKIRVIICLNLDSWTLTNIFYLQDLNDNAPVLTAGRTAIDLLEDYVEYKISRREPRTIDFQISGTDLDRPVSLILFVNAKKIDG